MVEFVGRRRQSVLWRRRRRQVQPLYARLQVFDHPAPGQRPLFVRPLFRQKLADLSQTPLVPGQVHVRDTGRAGGDRRRRNRRLPLQVPDCQLQDIRFFQFVCSAHVLSGLRKQNNDRPLHRCYKFLSVDRIFSGRGGVFKRDFNLLNRTPYRRPLKYTRVNSLCELFFFRRKLQSSDSIIFFLPATGSYVQMKRLGIFRSQARNCNFMLGWEREGEFRLIFF